MVLFAACINSRNTTVCYKRGGNLGYRVARLIKILAFSGLGGLPVKLPLPRRLPSCPETRSTARAGGLAGQSRPGPFQSPPVMRSILVRASGSRDDHGGGVRREDDRAGGWGHLSRRTGRGWNGENRNAFHFADFRRRAYGQNGIFPARAIRTASRSKP
jgi:hypothetical protein